MNECPLQLQSSPLVTEWAERPSKGPLMWTKPWTGAFIPLSHHTAEYGVRLSVHLALHGGPRLGRRPEMYTVSEMNRCTVSRVDDFHSTVA